MTTVTTILVSHAGVLYVVLLIEGLAIIVGTLLHRAGIKTFISPRGLRKRPVPVGAFLLFGAGLVLGACVQMIPAAYQRVWALWLLPVDICLFLASLALLGISLGKPEVDRPELD
jgi:hypothetical protein